MTKDEDRQYRSIHQQVVDQLFMRSATIAGEAVRRGVKYKTACEAIYGAHYQGLFGSALRALQNQGKVSNSMTMNDAWVHRAVHELVVHEIIKKAFFYLDSLDDRHMWSISIVKKKKPKTP